jgi:hypothetical protein
MEHRPHMRCATDTDVRIEYERVSQHHYGHFEDDQKMIGFTAMTARKLIKLKIGPMPILGMF